MRVDEKEVRRIARLARLALDDSEIALFAGELSDILDYIDQIEEEPAAVDETESNIPPLREDLVLPSLPIETLRTNAPAFALDHFVVPRVIGNVVDE